MNIFKIFTKEYKDETKYRELIKNNIKVFKLKSDKDNIEDKIKLLLDKKDNSF